jgi:thymidylate synthase (FAD)
MSVGVEIRFRSDFTVDLVADGCTPGRDRFAATSAWAEHPDRVSEGRDDTADGHRRVIRPCVKLGHNVPFEHLRMAVYIEAPGVVWWQLTRHRFMSINTEDFSFSMESGRYKVLEPEFYVPPAERPIWEPDGFKPMRPVLKPGYEWSNGFERESMRNEACDAWARYERRIGSGVAREVARMCLPNWTLYCDGIVSASAWAWLQFFSKRRSAVETKLTTFPQWEIEQVAIKCEERFAELFPVVYDEFVTWGRVAK